MKKILLLIATVSCSQFSFPQSYFYNDRYYDNLWQVETGVSTGAMNCLTDLGGKPARGKPFFKDINWNCTRFCAGLFVSALFRYTIGARLEASLGAVTGADSLLKKNVSDAVHRYQRNLHFRSKIAEIVLLAEFHPLSLLIDPYEFSPGLSPYLLAGIGLFAFDPQTSIAGNWVSLRPLRTEGQGFREHPGNLPYKTTALNFPVGAGLKYELSAVWNARLEIVHRFLKTDYLDDVSKQYIDPRLFYQYHDAARAYLSEQLADRRPLNATFSSKRGNPRNNDVYFSINFKLSIMLNRRKR